jgi:hypothetical protein
MSVKANSLSAWAILACIGVAEVLADDAGLPATQPSAAKVAPSVEALSARVADLEAEVATLRRQLAEANAAAGRLDARAMAAIRERSRQRMRDDVARYSQPQLIEIERLYQLSNEPGQRGTPAAMAALEKLIATFPDSNRAGCAVLYLAQWSQGERREKLLRDAIDNHAGDFYGDGCQVGPYAMFQFARDYERAGEAEKAKKLDDELRTHYPHAIDHNQQTLVSQIGR